MTEKDMTIILAQAMNGRVGNALRMFMGDKFGQAVSAIAACNGENAAYLAGVLRGEQIIAEGLEGMDVAAKMMEE